MEFSRTHERSVTTADEGSDWLYIDPATKKRHRVEIDVVPDRARKIRVQHLDREMRGKSEWVPIARAKVPWSLREDYEATVEVWAAAEKHRPPVAHSEVATILLSVYIAAEIAELAGNGATGVLEIRDVDALAARTGMTPAELASHENAFFDGATYAPWPTVVLVLRALCQRDPRPAVELVGERRAKEQDFALGVARDGDPWWADDSRDGHAKTLRQWHERSAEETRFLRELVDGTSPSLVDDYLRLREMYLDLVRLMPRAMSRIKMVRAQLSEDLIAEIQIAIDRPLPNSAQILGAEPPAENG